MNTENIRQYPDFNELLYDMYSRGDAPALIYEADGEKKIMSYRLLAGRISALCRLPVPEGSASVQVINCDGSVENVIRIIALCAMERDILIADPAAPKELLDGTVKKMEETRAEWYERSSDDPERDNMPKPGDSRICFFTSGTSESSRVVILTPHSLMTSAWTGQCMLSCGPGDVILNLLPLSHVFGFVCGMLWGLSYGAAVAPGRGPRHIMDDCSFYGPTILPVVPSIADALVRFGALNPGLKIMLIGGAAPSDTAIQSIRQRGISLYLGYGLTETSSGIAITQDTSEPAALYACPGADIRLEEDGEITVATPCLMGGYLGEEFLPEGSRFHTGDIGSFDERGRLHLTGRKKEMIVLPDGTKVFCPEAEEKLTAALAGKAAASPSDRTPIKKAELAVTGHGGRPVLIVSTDNRAGIDDAVRSTVDAYNRELPRSQQIADIFYTKAPLPRTAVGKLKRWMLDELLCENGKEGSNA